MSVGWIAVHFPPSLDMTFTMAAKGVGVTSKITSSILAFSSLACASVPKAHEARAAAATPASSVRASVPRTRRGTVGVMVVMAFSH